MMSFLNRNKDKVSQRLATNINRNRATLTEEEFASYFQELLETTKDVPASNIFNYDETNVVDNTGKKKMLFRRGTLSISNFTNLYNFFETKY